ncbi:MAG: PKD domain containing protein [candidate division TM6 bacterium GW2011_GWF2_33_332]|nr:MAG: PKD domain containing protein [candidate division TM6 bacterium GW2011_GWF2_33_332]
MKQLFFGLLFGLSIGFSYSQQFDIAGAATDAGGLCYNLTTTTGQSGAVWNQNTIDLTQPFDISVTLNFGNNDADNYPDPLCGADGISFILQPNGTGISSTGAGVGFEWIVPSFGVLMDTYSANPTDPLGDHISIHQNGDPLHGTANELMPHTSAVGFPYNVEDGADHTFRFVWTPGGTAQVYFDGVLSLTYTGDIVTNIFGGNTHVFWGFSSSTGGCWNIQTVCFDIMADFITASDACVNETVSFTDQSQSTTAITTWNWNFGDGSTSTLQNPSHTYTVSGIYNVTLEVIDMGGFSLTTTIPIEIFALPSVTANANENPLCEGQQVILSGGGAATYIWDGGVTNGTAFLPAMGTTEYNVTGTDANGCTNTSTIDIIVNSNPSPDITGILDFCTGSNTTLDAGSFSTYAWSPSGTTQTITLTTGGNYSVTVTDINGCTGTDLVTVTQNTGLSPSISGTLNICPGNTTTLNAGSGYALYYWSTTDVSQTIDVVVAGTYSVTVSDANGCTGNASVTVNVFSNPSPVITGDTQICPGTTTTLDAGAGFAAYLWSTTDMTQSVSELSSGNYSVTVADANGCTGTNNIIVTELTNPVPVITGNPEFCAGSSAIINAGLFTSYIWSTSQVTQSITVTTSGIYSVTVTDANGCTGTDNISITANPLPVVSAGPDQSACNGASINLTASGGNFYLWNTGDPTATITVSPSSTTTFYVTVTDLNGCTGTDNVTVNIGDIYLDLGSDRLVCKGESVILTASVSMGTLPISYIWSTGGTSASIGLDVDSDATYFVTIVDATGCSATDQVSVETHPELSFNLFVSENEICEGETVSFNGNITGGPGAPYYVFHDENIVALPYTVSPATGNTYTFTAQDLCGQEVEQTIAVTVNPIPQFTIQSDISASCPPAEISFSANPETGSPYSSYTWSFNDPNHGFSNSSDPTYNFEEAGVFDVSLAVTSTKGCSNTIVFEDLITIYQQPTANFFPDPQITSFVNADVYFGNYSAFGDYFYWDFRDGDSSTAASPMHHFDDIGLYNVELVVSTIHGCTDTVYQLIEITDEYTFFAPDAFTPNGDQLNDKFFVTGNGIDPSTFTMLIYDRWGELIYETNEYDINEPSLSGWDGKVQGSRKLSETGVYTWLVMFRHNNGIMHEYSGAVTVMW